jgi:hypothetical protein
VWDYAFALTGYDAGSPGTVLLLWIAFVTALPVLFAPVAAWLRGRGERPDFWRRLEQLALAYAVAGASFATAVASADGFGQGDGLERDWSSMAVIGAVALAAGLGVMAVRPGTSGRMAGAIIAGAAAVPLLAYTVNDLDVPAALLFMLLWAGIAAAALVAHWRGVFQLAVAAIALRLIILSFELASDLLLSGFGLIVAGVLILGVAWAAVRVSKTFAPRSEEGEA